MDIEEDVFLIFCKLCDYMTSRRIYALIMNQIGIVLASIVMSVILKHQCLFPSNLYDHKNNLHKAKELN